MYVRWLCHMLLQTNRLKQILKLKCISVIRNIHMYQVSYDLYSYERNLSNCLKKSGLQRGLNPLPRDTGATL